MSEVVGLGGLALLMVTSFTPLSSGLAHMIGGPEHLPRADGIVVLGHGVSRDGVLSDGSLRRAVHGIRLYRKGLAPLLVLCGGANEGGATEAEVQAGLAADFGIPQEAILTIPARTTSEEADRVAAALRPHGARDILLITDSLHMGRAQLAFERRGFAVAAAPIPSSHSADTPGGRLHLMRSVARELVARLYYRI
jgi:uncharacterized SAM-binding protein YcdF (DUF218 family)